MEVLTAGAAGPSVELVQSILKRLGFYTGEVTGKYDETTAAGVKAFRLDFGLTADSDMDDSAWRALMPYINGWTEYIVKKGDTLYKIAEQFGTSVKRIVYANPGIDPDIIHIGQRLRVPFGRVVPTNISYTSELLNFNIAALKTIYPFLQSGIMGYSVLGKSIPYIRIGKGKNKVFYSGAIHANEWIVTPVLMKFLEDYSLACVNNGEIFGYPARKIYDRTSIYIAPMCNPDGVDLAAGRTGPGSPIYEHARRIAAGYPEVPFPTGWKANINGVDLNLQFPAGWEQAREIKFSQGVTTPAPRDYVGITPLSEPESVGLYHFTRLNDFALVLAYHTQGKEIYWQFMDYAGAEAYKIGQEFSRVSGYLLADVPYTSSFAGYKDWFLQEYGRPGYTIEAGIGENPLPISQFDEIYRDNLGILVLGALQ